MSNNQTHGRREGEDYGAFIDRRARETHDDEVWISDPLIDEEERLRRVFVSLGMVIEPEGLDGPANEA